MRAARKRRRELGLEQRAFGNAHIDQIVKPVVKQNLRIENHDHVDAEEHAKHVFIEQKVDRILALRVGPVKIEHHALTLAPHRAFDLERAGAHAIVADVVLKRHRRFADGVGDQVLHRAVIARQQFFGRRDIHIIAKAVGHLDHAARRHPARCDQRVEIGLAPIGLTRLIHHQLNQIVVVFALLPDFHRWNAHALFKDRARIDRHRADDFAADIRLMAKHRGIADDPASLENGQQHQPVVRMADRAGAAIRV